MTIYTPEHVAEAEARIAETRARLLGTLGEVQQRLSPSNLAQDAVDSATASVAAAVRKGTDAVRSRPLAVAGAAGAIGLVLARGWIADIFKGAKRETPAGGAGNETPAGGAGNETGAAPDSLRPKRAPRTKKGPAS
ncbi:MAG: DUF3618 domain-containing protein [Pseudomonadota bacterium]